MAFLADNGNLKASVDALHADRVARGVLHAGGTCACAHLTRVVLGAVKPITVQATEPEPEPVTTPEPGADPTTEQGDTTGAQEEQA